jgi:hypothetical protein
MQNDNLNQKNLSQERTTNAPDELSSDSKEKTEKSKTPSVRVTQDEGIMTRNMSITENKPQDEEYGAKYFSNIEGPDIIRKLSLDARDEQTILDLNRQSSSPKSMNRASFSKIKNSNFTIRDNSSMIAPDEFPTIRSDFSRVDSDNQGQNGLAVDKNIVKQSSDSNLLIDSLNEKIDSLKATIDDYEQRSTDDLSLIIELQKKNKELQLKIENDLNINRTFDLTKNLDSKNIECDNLRLNLKKTNFEAIKMRQNNTFLKQNLKATENMVKNLERKIKETEENSKLKESEFEAKILTQEEIIYLIFKKFQAMLPEEKFSSRLLSNPALKYLMIKYDGVDEGEVLDRLFPEAKPLSQKKISHLKVPDIRDSVFSFDENYSMPNFEVFKKPANPTTINLKFPEIQEESMSPSIGKPDSNISFTINAININNNNSNTKSPDHLQSNPRAKKNSNSHILDVTLSENNESFDCNNQINSNTSPNKNNIKDQLNSMIKLRTNFRTGSNRTVTEIGRKDKSYSDPHQIDSANTLNVDIKVSNMNLSGLFPEDIQIKVVDLLDDYLNGSKNETTFKITETEKERLKKKCKNSSKKTLRHMFLRVFKIFVKYINYLEIQVNKIVVNHSYLAIKYDTFKEDHKHFVKNVLEQTKINPDIHKSALDQYSKLKMSSLANRNELSKSNLIQQQNLVRRSSILNSKLLANELTPRQSIDDHMFNSNDFYKTDLDKKNKTSETENKLIENSPKKSEFQAIKRNSNDKILIRESIFPIPISSNTNINFVNDDLKTKTIDQQLSPMIENSNNQTQSINEVLVPSISNIRTPSEQGEPETLTWKPVKGEHYRNVHYTSDPHSNLKNISKDATMKSFTKIPINEKLKKEDTAAILKHPSHSKFESKESNTSNAFIHNSTDSKNKEKRQIERRFLTKPKNDDQKDKNHERNRSKSSSSDDSIWAKFTKVFKK